ncbi:MAG: MarR family transcriptional regulator [Pseudopelagicola sp.]|nr:MarR family transcriptional regulator [Pseudopelagicola sp.]
MLTESFNLHFLLHSASLVEERLRTRMAGIGISHSQARVIDALARMGAVSQVRLAREFNISAASMSTMTARLIEAGLITRTVNPNETRSNIVELTPKGRELMSDIHTAWRDIDSLIVDTMGADDAAHIATLTRALRDRLGGKAPGAKQVKDTEKEMMS